MEHLLGHRDTKELEQDWQVFGPPPDEFMQAMAVEDFELWPENQEPFELFLRLQTQWTRGPAGNLVGLNYAGVLAAMQFMGMPSSPELFDQLQAMERTVLKTMKAAA